ncbi:hypothetical protein XA68_16685 [Ophiocordyceps unilateralis]|uniref:Cytochrome b5 heme-binding domain-containing protein n=1 Tax=Ophiocordyceps unilateralis TaxID=268505 RepID=A0A2A9PJK6_OPHUN|nr:hypothetical protein XA68_16685 [Ophiocordyceps unilateralis]
MHGQRTEPRLRKPTSPQHLTTSTPSRQPGRMDYVEQRIQQEALQSSYSTTALLTPLNLVLATALVYSLYKTLLSSSAGISTPPSPPPPPTVFRTYTPHTLLPFNGTSDRSSRIYLAVRGRVFDVSRGAAFYGPQGPYANFAGRDASRGLALGSFDDHVLTADLDADLDPLLDLGPDELEALAGWEERFLEKYDVVGRLVSVREFDALRKDGSGRD